MLKIDDYKDPSCSKPLLVHDDHRPAPGSSRPRKLLTVCVPSYNAEACLDHCLDTLIDHSMAPYMEVLVIDDGSADRTAAIGHVYEDRYPGIVRVISKENGGHGSTINRAIEEARGLYFKNVDSDDWVDSRQLEDLLKAIQSGQIRADIISSNYHEVDSYTLEETPILQKCRLIYGQVYTFDTLPLQKIYITMHSMTIKTKILKDMPARLQEHTFYVDMEYILFPVPFLTSIVFTDHFIYKYSRGREEQSVALSTMVKRYDQHARVVKRVIRYGEKISMSPSAKTYYDEVLKRIICTHYMLGLAFDEDKERGLKRTKAFDRFLCKVRPDLAGWAGRKMLILAAARRCHYDPVRLEHSALMLVRKIGENVLTTLTKYATQVKRKR